MSYNPFSRKNLVVALGGYSGAITWHLLSSMEVLSDSVPLPAKIALGIVLTRAAQADTARDACVFLKNQANELMNRCCGKGETFAKV